MRQIIAKGKELTITQPTMPTSEVISQMEIMTIGSPTVAEGLGTNENLKRKILRARRKATGEEIGRASCRERV